ncbi:MAG: class I SAM-dependent methyltransferase [Pseudomonadota bacterium]
MKFIDNVWRDSRLLSTANSVAKAVLKIAGRDIQRFIAGYRWMCGMMMEEGLYFQRHGTYRLSSFAEVDAFVYQQPEIMQLYMNGLLLSQALWPNHVQAVDFYRNKFLTGIKPGGLHLEIGPGHGLLLHYAMQVLTNHPQAWDISQTAINSTRESLNALGGSSKAELIKCDIMGETKHHWPKFDSVVLSEVLEHCEQPESMLRKVVGILAPGGKLFINVPVNSPAVDHIFLFKSPEEIELFITRNGLMIEDMLTAPAAGLDELTARKRKSTISCIFNTKAANNGCHVSA